MVVFLLAIEFALGTLLVVFVVTQLLAPLVNGTKLFPLFRKDRRAAENAFTDSRERAEVSQIWKDRKAFNKEQSK